MYTYTMMFKSRDYHVINDQNVTWSPYQSACKILLATVMSAFEHTIESIVCGFHVYKDAWVPVLHEVLQIKQEFDNEEDQHAVAVIKTTILTK